MKFGPALMILLVLSACGYGTRSDEYAINRRAATGPGAVGGPVLGVNPVSGQLMGAAPATSARALGNPNDERYSPRRASRGID